MSVYETFVCDILFCVTLWYKLVRYLCASHVVQVFCVAFLFFVSESIRNTAAEQIRMLMKESV